MTALPNGDVARRGRASPGRIALLLVLVLTLALAACGGSRSAGKRLQNKRVDDPVRRESVSTSVGTLRLLHIRIEQPDEAHAAGTNSALFLSIANDGTKADTLVAVSSVDAQSIIQRDGGEEPETQVRIPIKPGKVASLQYAGGPHLEMNGLKRDLGRREFVPVTFRFATAGPVSVKVFVQGVDHPVVSPLPTPTPTG